jgi:hypothetical protein
MSVGWYPFCNPFINFSSNLGEGNIFWKFQKEINEYITRVQYALRSGNPHSDVLIYFPFMNVDGMPDNPEEILTKGYIEGVEPALPASTETLAKDKATWAEKIYPVINLLEANGFTWEWVNDASIQEARVDGNQINIRGNLYQALILVDISTIQLKTAKRISELAKKGMKFLATGTLPIKQPSFLNWEVNDKLTEHLMAEVVKQKNSRHIQDENELKDWLKQLNQLVKFNGQFTFTRQLQRDMSDGSRIQFIWNKSNSWQPISLILNKKFKNAGWLNAETGSIALITNTKNASYTLPPYSSVILYASIKNRIPESLLSKSDLLIYQAKEVLKIEKWDISTNTVSLRNSSLFDWRINEGFKFSSNEGIYKSFFQLDEINPDAVYLIDLGNVYFTAEVIINGKPAGRRIYAPYSLNITGLIKQGENSVEVHVTPGQLNGFIGEAIRGNKLYNAFKGKQNSLMAAGLVGPVAVFKK